MVQSDRIELPRLKIVHLMIVAGVFDRSTAGYLPSLSLAFCRS
jgi:hypothetical protein